jgi:hypothetical protein
MVQLRHRFRVNSEEVASKVIDEEAIIINLTTGVYYSMDRVGARIWSLLEGHHDLGAIAAALELEYDAPLDRIQADVERLVGELKAEGLLAATDEAPVVEAGPGNGGERREYVPPVLNIYRDMGDLLALDPPVPGLEPIPWNDPQAKQSETTD